ncbi:ARM repeat-containing protein [Calocera viscosa TUFC12733]|uniref:Importin-95 n=1 Tax=Calocera viscosa (strain TUFC12733) TaxID=1330018 RepID=A0A167NCZ0_CALVF|nr:ARM repeat-containing protein [Calocera viscosa TUFC12733]
MDPAQILANTYSGDAATREDATARLDQAATENFPAYMAMLSAEVANESRDQFIRNAAGLAIKNALSVRDPKRQNEMSQRWLAVDANTRQQVKNNCFMALHSSNTRAGAVSAQDIAALAAIELPAGTWPELIEQLLGFVNNAGNAGLRMATLQAIGYICEQVKPEILQTRSNEILTAVVQGARKDEPEPEVQLAAVNALYNSLEFVRDNFEREGERNYIMQVVCEATQSLSVPVQVAAFECLVRIMNLYYDKMGFYMERALFGLTVLGMRSSEPNVALQAIEFWSTVCDEEIDIIVENTEAEEYGEIPTRTCKNFAKIALNEILPVLLTLLSTQDEDADEEEWNVSMAAAHCLSLLAQVVADDIVPLVVPYIEAHIKSADWHQREAAVMAFGSIIEGPSSKVLQPIVGQGLAVLIPMMNDPHPAVKDTVAWTLGKISDLMLSHIPIENFMVPLINAFVQGLDEKGRIAPNCCWGLMNIAIQLDPTDGDPESTPDGGPLSPYFDGIVNSLWRVTDRRDNDHNIRTTAYEAISTYIEHCNKDNLNTVGQLAQQLLVRMETLLSQANEILGTDDRNNWHELMSNICGVLISVTRKTGGNISHISDRMMTDVLQLATVASRTSTVLEDVFLVLGAAATSLEQAFLPYLNAFLPFLLASLKAHEETQLVTVAVGLIGDICRALGDQCLPYCNAFMTALIENLQSDTLARSVKIPILQAIGDIAIAIGGNFEHYLSTIMEMLKQAGAMEADPLDASLQEYVIRLRDGIIDAYVGIVQAMRASHKENELLPYIPSIFTVILKCLNDDEYDRTDTSTRTLLGLLGELAIMYPAGQIKEYLLNDAVVQTLKYTRGRSKMTKATAKWAKDAVKKATA